MKQGGKRKGAGRKSASYKTKTIAFRVRAEWIEHIKQIVKNEVEKLLKNADVNKLG
jgi:hypothetical protein